MKELTILPNRLGGEIEIPPSKSLSHRAIICGGLAEGVSKINNLIFSEDIKATIEGIEAFGAQIEYMKAANRSKKNTIIIKGNGRIAIKKNIINCRESGSTLRFLIPFSGLVGEEVIFEGRGKLVERPLDSYYKIFEEHNIDYKATNNGLPLKIKGRLSPGTYRVPGNISSQYITGLALSLPLLEGDSKIIITSPLESKGYLDLTVDMLNRAGIKVENKRYEELNIKGNQKYRKLQYTVEGDFSQAAFWIVAGLLGGKIKCNDLKIDSLQGDKAILKIIKDMGANYEQHKDGIIVDKCKTIGTTIDASQCPDLVPILAVLGALSEGETRIVNAQRLRIKESNRLKAISTELSNLGADIKEMSDGLIISGKNQLKGGIVEGWNDHRIVMALAIASIKCKESVTIKGWECVSKSYPEFWEDFKKLGGKIDE